MKPKFLITSFTSCSGCIVDIISSDIFPVFLERVTLTHFPFITDDNIIQDCDVALIEGCISEENQIAMLKSIRHHAKKVYALGTCAAFGGILSLSEEKRADPLSDYIEVNGIIPGCPPPSQLLGNVLIRLIEGRELELSNKNMCANCPITEKIDKNSATKILKFYPDSDEIEPKEETTCFLKRGILCMGPITREGCEYECIKQGIPCEGCMGPVSKDFTSNMVNFLSIIDISEKLIKNNAFFYRFSKPRLWREK